MKTPQKFISFLAGAALLAASNLNAATTDPVGYVTVNILGSQTTFVSLPLQSPVAEVSDSVGTLTGVSTNNVSNSSANWAVDTYAGTTPHYIKITSGNANGSLFKISTNTSDTLTLDTDGLDLTTSGITNGDSYEVFAGDTLRGAFGDTSNGIVGGTDPNGAVDVVYVLSDGAWAAYYFNTSADQWREGIIPFSKDNVAIAPGTAVLFSRVGVSDLEYVFTGRVPVTDFLSPTNPNGFTAYASYFPTVQTLSELNLQNLSWWQSVGDPGITVSNSDKVYFFKSGAWAAYHYNTSVGQWREGVIPFDKGGESLDAAGGFLISREGAPSVQQITVGIPYTL